ncbi:MAG: hypothetical protein ACI9JR_001989 [Gammaproteobacteria bacterium]
MIGVRDVNRGYKQMTEYGAHGIGLLQLSLSANFGYIILDINGIPTHQKSGHEKLNLNFLQCYLVYLNTKIGRQRHLSHASSTKNTSWDRHFIIRIV